VRAGRLWVGPPWHQPEHPAVVIDPGHAFGTGAHGSTRAALLLLQRLAPGPVLDVGCGSGVLAIAAARLGFGPPAPLGLAHLALGLLQGLVARTDAPPLVPAAGLLASQSLGGAERAVCDGWAAELVRR
jgi:hypothetical protein